MDAGGRAWTAVSTESRSTRRSCRPRSRVPVGPFRLLDAGVLQLVPHPPQIGAGLQHPCRVGVPHRVRLLVGQLGGCQQRLPNVLGERSVPGEPPISRLVSQDDLLRHHN